MKKTPSHEQDCLRFDALIAASLDAELDAAGERELAAHLAGCSACRELSLRLRESALALESIPAPSPVSAAARDVEPIAPLGAERDEAANDDGRRGARSGVHPLFPRWIELSAVAAAAGLLVYLATRASAPTAGALGQDATPLATRELAGRLESAERRIQELEANAATRRAAPEPATSAPSPTPERQAASPAPSASSAPSVALAEPERTAPPTPRSSENGTLSVQCTPACEHVYVDGLDMGTSPMKATFAVGNHQIKAISGDVTRLQSVDVKANREAALRISMRPSE